MEKIFSHIFAAFMGCAFDSELAKDYWLTKNKPWDYLVAVKFRFLKFLYIYSASATIQCVIPVLLIFSIFELKEKIVTGYYRFHGTIWGIAGIIIAVSYLVGLIMAAVEYYKTRKKMNRMASRTREGK